MADMDHNEAIRLLAAEKYVLSELEPGVRDAFEEHFFGCTDCALDVKAAFALREHCRTALADSPAPVSVTVKKKSAGWLQWLRPAIAAPAIAALLVVIGIQNLGVQPTLRDSKTEAPQVLPSVSLINVNTRGVDNATVRVHAGEAFLLFVDIPPDQHASSYEAELLSPDGERKWTIAISADAAKDTVAIRVPLGLKKDGMYTLVVRTASPSGGGAEVGRYPFDLRLY